MERTPLAEKKTGKRGNAPFKTTLAPGEKGVNTPDCLPLRDDQIRVWNPAGKTGGRLGVWILFNRGTEMRENRSRKKSAGEGCCLKKSPKISRRRLKSE